MSAPDWVTATVTVLEASAEQTNVIVADRSVTDVFAAMEMD
jgi:hypothetical protein